jgi:N-acetylglutamate synthase-like GNAT family acetyltransferase
LQNTVFFTILPPLKKQLKRPMYVKEITNPSEQDIQSLKRLLQTLSSNCTFSDEKLKQLIQAEESHLYGLYDEESQTLAGCCCLGIYYSITGKKACLEDVTVLPEFQGKGGGRMLVAHATEEARKLQAEQMMFTSKPTRIQANKLYQKMGFPQKETNVYLKKW